MEIECNNDVPIAPRRPKDGHKGTFGSVLVVGGSRGMAGAASLAGQSALHGGTGLVTIAVPDCIVDTVAQFHPAYMTLPIDCDGTCFTPVAARELVELANGKSAVALGPGIGKGPGVWPVVQALYQECAMPLVLDADGLNAFVGRQEQLVEKGGIRVLTPHPGEFARIVGKSVGEVQKHRQELAVEFARRFAVVLVLKGTSTIVTDGKQLGINATGSDALATGGTGDILTGLVAALLAQGMAPFDAARLGAHLHGMAGEIAGNRHSAHYTTALEVLGCLADAWQHHLQQ